MTQLVSERVDESPPCDPPRSPVAARLPVAWWAALVALMLAEAVTLGVRFEGVEETFGGGRWWSGLLSRADHFLKLFLVAATAFLLFGGRRLVGEYRRLARVHARPARAWPWAIAHLAAFAGFFRLTALVLEGGVAGSPAADAWVIGWAAAGLATLVLWIAAVVPVRDWVPLVTRCRSALAGGLAVGLAAWAAGQGTLALWRPLNRATFWLVLALLHVVMPQTVANPETSRLGTPEFSVTIAPECSGYEGIGLIWTFLGAYLWVYRRDFRFPRALLLIPVGTVLIGLANAVRIAALVMVGTWFSRAVALGGFHSQGGWIAFLAVSLGLFLTAQHVKFLRAAGPPGEAAAGPNPTAPYLAPLFAIMATAMVTGAFSDGFDVYYALRVLAATAVFWVFRGGYPALGFSWHWPSVALGAAVFVVWMALDPATPWAGASVGADDPIERGVFSLPPAWATFWVLFRIIGSVVTVPLAEELAFRGYLMRRLVASDFESVPPGWFTWWSFLASSMLFGTLHGRWLAGMLAGLAYAGAVYGRGKLGDAVLAHATTNALIAAWVLAMGQWSLWD